MLSVSACCTSMLRTAMSAEVRSFATLITKASNFPSIGRWFVRDYELIHMKRYCLGGSYEVWQYLTPPPYFFKLGNKNPHLRCGFGRVSAHQFVCEGLEAAERYL